MQTKKPVIMMIIGGLGDGGKERQLVLLLKMLRERNHFSTILVVCNAGGERELEARKYADKTVIFKKRQGINLISPLIKIIQQIKLSDAQIIHTWGSGVWDLVGLFAAKWCRKSVLINGIQSAPANLHLSDNLTRFSAYFAESVVANSEAGLRAFRLDRLRKSTVIYNGLDLSRFQDVNSDALDKNLCMVANFREEKDHKTLIIAMSTLMKRYPRVTLTLVGHDYGTLKSIQDFSDKLGTSDHIVYVTDCLEPKEIVGKSLICILSTHGEGVSNVLLEYMALSKPIIVTNNGGNPEVVIDQVNGYLIPPKSPESIVEKVGILFSDRKLAKKMGKAGNILVKQKFSLEVMVDAFEVMYSRLIEQRHE